MNGKNLAMALKKGDYVFGTAMVSQSVSWPGVLASLGMDFVFIDTEHTPLGRETVSRISHMYKAHGLAPLVRIPAPDPYQASMVLDGGASGVIAPYVETADQVRQLVGAVKYKPLKGRKLDDALNGKAPLNTEISEYLKKRNENHVLVVNIESVPALENLDEILSVEGLDAVLVGPHDLTCSLGIPEQYDHPLFVRSVETLIGKARRKKIGAGIHVWDAVGYDREIEWAKKGANLIVHSNDRAIFSRAISTDLREIKKELKLHFGEENAMDVIV